MREIKFRGKRRDNGEWAYGLPGYGSGGEIEKISGWMGEEDNPLYDEIEVIPETIGEYTGLKDSKENEIWEDDIISDGERRWHITWQHLNARFGYIYKSKSNGDTFDGRLPAQTGIQEYLMKKVIVIGNIHDNKELLNPQQ